MKIKKEIYTEILVAALHLMQGQGYNAFSYADLSKEVGIKTSSIHYHFPTKADLGKAVIQYYIDTICVELEALLHNVKLHFREKLSMFFDIVFESTYLNDNKMCLGGMLASDILTLPKSMRTAVKKFFDKMQAWLIQLIEQGLAAKECKAIQDISREAGILFALLEGALLLARLYQDESRLYIVKEEALLRLAKS